MSTRTLVLGGGFGDIATAVELRRLLGDEHEVALVDSKPEFALGLHKLWALVGGHWHTEPQPVVTITGSSATQVAEKAAFETEHLERWFGS